MHFCIFLLLQLQVILIKDAIQLFNLLSNDGKIVSQLTGNESYTESVILLPSPSTERLTISIQHLIVFIRFDYSAKF